MSSADHSGHRRAQEITLEVRHISPDGKKRSKQSNAGSVRNDNHVKVRTQHSRPVSSLIKNRPKTSTSSPSSASSRGSQINISKDQASSGMPPSVNPYRNMTSVVSARTRKNVFFSESAPGHGEDRDSSSSDSEACDGDINQVRRANGYDAFSCHSPPGTSPVRASAGRSGTLGRLSSASSKLLSSSQVTPSTPATPTTPRPGTSRQRKPLFRQASHVDTEEKGNANVTDGPARSGKRNVTRENGVASRTPHKPSEKSPGRNARGTKGGRPRYRCFSTASFEDAISSSGSSSTISSPRGHGSHRHLHSPQSSIETPPPNSLLPGSARSIGQGGAGPNANGFHNVSPAWSMFENHVKLIDDCTGSLSNVPRRTFISSPVFQNVMTDLYGRPEYSKTRAFLQLRSRVGNVAAYASRFLGRVKALHAMRASSEEFNDDDVDFDFEFDDDFVDGRRRQPSAETVENAKRAWRILRNHVMEEAAKKRMSRPALAWDVIRHTLRAGSNLERARLDIYQRYGLIPMVLPDGRVVQENTMLSERARQALANKPQKTAPQSNGRVSRQSISMPSRKTMPYKGIEGFSGYSRSETM